MISINGNGYEPYIGGEILEKVTKGSDIIWERETGATDIYIGSLFQTSIEDDKLSLDNIPSLKKEPAVDNNRYIVFKPRAKYSELYPTEDEYWDAMLDGDDPMYKDEDEWDRDNALALGVLCPVNSSCRLVDMITAENLLERPGVYKNELTIDGTVYKAYILRPSTVIPADYRVMEYGTYKILF